MIIHVAGAVVAPAHMDIPKAEIAGVTTYNYDPHKIGASSANRDGKRTWVLSTKDGVSDKQLHEICEDIGKCDGEGHPDEGGLEYVAVTATQSELETLVKKHKDKLEFLEPSMPIHLIKSVGAEDESSTMDPVFAWNLDRIDAAKGLDDKYSPDGDGAGAHVYVFDTGVRTTHKDFEGRATPYLDVTVGCNQGGDAPCRAMDCQGALNCAVDTDGHGTHCAGTIGGRKSGVAKKVNIYGVKVLCPPFNCGSTYTLAFAIDYVLQNGKKPAVISMSLGARGWSGTMAKAIDAAHAGGVTVVVASGNDNANSCDYMPGNVLNATNVGAIDQTDTRASFSNYGKCVDIWAPGVDVLSAYPKTGGRTSDQGYTSMDGTSMACPAVSGAIAVLLAKNPKMSSAEVQAALAGGGTKMAVKDAQEGSPEVVLKVGTKAKVGGGESRSGGGTAPAPAAKQRRRRRRDPSRRRRRRRNPTTAAP